MKPNLDEILRQTDILGKGLSELDFTSDTEALLYVLLSSLSNPQGSNISANDVNTLINAYDISKKSNSAWGNKKLVTVGDSITAQNLYQPYLSQWFGFQYNYLETQQGVGGYRPTALAGTKIVPTYKASNPVSYEASGASIYMRADDVQFYNPDLIILYGARNDASNNLGTAEEAPYTGPEIEITSGNTIPTLAAAFKGTIFKLITQNPNARIIALGQMHIRPANTITNVNDYNTLENGSLLKNNLIKDCCLNMSIPFVDLWNNTGVNFYNAANFYGGDLSQNEVHPNQLGHLRIAQTISQYL